MPPAHKPTPEIEAKVEACASHGVPIKMIAKYLGIGENTLRKHYGDVIEASKVEKIMKVSDCLYQSAINGNMTAALFYLKTQAYWREKDRDEDKVSDNDTINKIQIEVIGAKATENKDAK